MMKTIRYIGPEDLPDALDKNSKLLRGSFLKRIFDILFSLGLLVVCIPLFIFIAIIIKINSRGPVFYLQERVGRNGRNFVLYKFRTMSTDGHPVSGEDYTKDQNHRITSVGKILRDTGLDEFPQLINVLKGEMSVVGPRPQPVPQVEYYLKDMPNYNLRHEVKPGLTGMVQISDLRSDVALHEQGARLQLDLYYINNWSYWLDIYIIVMTGLTVIPRYRLNIKKYPKENR